MKGKVRDMDRVRRRAVGKLGALEFKSDLVWAGLKIDKSLEVRIAHRPAGWWEGVVLSADDESPLKVILLRLSNCAVQQENLLIYLGRNVSNLFITAAPPAIIEQALNSSKGNHLEAIQ